MEVDTGPQVRQLAKHAWRRHWFGAAPAADDVHHAVSRVTLVIVDVTAHHQYFLRQGPGMSRQVTCDLLLVAHTWKERVAHRRIVQQHEDEFDLLARARQLLLEPGALLASGFQRRIRIQYQREQGRPDRYRVPAMRPQGQLIECAPPVFEAVVHLLLWASLEFVVAERRKHRDFL